MIIQYCMSMLISRGSSVYTREHVVTSSSNGRMKTVKLPWRLYKAILSLQLEHDLEFDEACLKASELINPNSDIFKKAVEREARRLAKSQFMSQLNAGRKTIRDVAYIDATNRVRVNEDNFRVPCYICGEHMYFSNRKSNWNEVKSTLYEAFKTWHHTECKK